MAYAFGYGAHHMAGFGFGFFNFLGTLLFIILIVWVIKFFVRGGRGGPPWAGRSYRWRDQGNDDALRTARERFAQGEITREQYDELRGGLERNGDSHGGPGRWFGSGDSAMELARMRFARGELTREEFDTIRKGLTA